MHQAAAAELEKQIGALDYLVGLHNSAHLMGMPCRGRLPAALQALAADSKPAKCRLNLTERMQVTSTDLVGVRR